MVKSVSVESIVRPGQTRNRDAAKYAAMRGAYLAVLPDAAPGLTCAEILTRVVAHLPEDQFPGGAKAGWWAKTVQLDLEAKGVIVREKGSPVRLHKT